MWTRAASAAIAWLLCGLGALFCGCTSDIVGVDSKLINDSGYQAVCGDLVCDAEETCSGCSSDCGVCPSCGDAACNGDETCSSCVSDCGPCAVLVEPVYPSFAAWGQYVQRSAGAPYLQSETACDPATAQGYSQCAHGGELRKVSVAFAASCNGLTAEDDLGALQWTCDAQSGNAVFYSTALKSTVPLSHLLTTAGFKQNAVTIRQQGTVIAMSAPGVWWSNPILPLPDNSGPADAVVQLSDAGAIYVLGATRDTQGYAYNADGVTVVMMPGAALRQVTAADNCTLVSGNPTRCAVQNDGSSFSWFEGEIHGMTGAVGVQFKNAKFPVIRHTRVQGARHGVQIADAEDGLLSDIVTSSTQFYGLMVFDSGYFIVRRINASSTGATDTGDAAIFVGGTSHHNTFTQIVISNTNEYGFLVYPGTSDNTFSHLTVTNVAYAAFDNQALRSTIVQMVSANADRGLRLTNSGGNNARIAQVALVHTLAMPIEVSSSTGHVFSGNLLIGDNGQGCTITGSASPGIDTSCNSGANLVSGVALANTFISKVTSTTQDHGASANWLTYAPYQGWGLGGSSFPDAAQRNSCQTGTCQLWDWRIKTTDTALYRRSFNGALAEAFVAGQACPSAVHGDVDITDGWGNNFLLNALEIDGDGVGNDNGLCESNERCIYSPHFGAYQGEGPLSSETCVFANATINGVQLYGYVTDGQ